MVNKRAKKKRAPCATAAVASSPNVHTEKDAKAISNNPDEGDLQSLRKPPEKVSAAVPAAGRSSRATARAHVRASRASARSRLAGTLGSGGILSASSQPRSNRIEFNSGDEDGSEGEIGEGDKQIAVDQEDGSAADVEENSKSGRVVEDGEEIDRGNDDDDDDEAVEEVTTKHAAENAAERKKAEGEARAVSVAGKKRTKKTPPAAIIALDDKFDGNSDDVSGVPDDIFEAVDAAASERRRIEKRKRDAIPDTAIAPASYGSDTVAPPIHKLDSGGGTMQLVVLPDDGGLGGGGDPLGLALGVETTKGCQTLLNSRRGTKVGRVSYKTKLGKKSKGTKRVGLAVMRRKMEARLIRRK
eukprot:CAMPEP_0194279850 /NCGR_PEP_ID=MMETSP0169-20130528/14161_1 /TAXON_ID=218684 /ORGANISM="Corethron pennatum, Strain L29A3" /LENGTH=356 /DNA_ID=CAMNT_0039024325 /DNA_START=69 /DNA_END=1139 /DNA_ORIENTATION=+